MFCFKVVAVFAACSSVAIANPVKERANTWNYDNQKVRGVNLGGWFVLEPWITPSLFEQWANGGGVVDEYTYTAALGKQNAQSRLTQHWSTFITEGDFKEIASFGLNHVRIPVGYWALNPNPADPYVQAPGSQNGFDNSGKYGAINWQSGDNVANTLTAIQNLVNRYRNDQDVVTAIELLNEPANWGNDMGLVKKFYYDGWGNVRTTSSNTAVVIHDAFLDPQSWNGFMGYGSGVNDVILDTHIYQIFSQGEVAMKPCQHVQTACASAGRIQNTDKWTIVGEWTGAQTDCARWLNGLGKGARYDGTFPQGSSGYYGSCQNKYTGTVDGMLQVDKTNLAYYVEAQLDAFFFMQCAVLMTTNA
ncbi:putative Glucan 1,3-beta-glucosidase [Glarea lozoyensis 74030]|uniref:glucan 1,3-beta-glucosidase n=1 Tax=Glarea lozoyensis (strain ATCC 74030 / MF5533) TaxID=1104152 RepID=H0EH18_GLAL7|nr:putative Glucan 1,3-beta-glucosidase [Glarea lozoyensis 74030]